MNVRWLRVFEFLNVRRGWDSSEGVPSGESTVLAFLSKIHRGEGGIRTHGPT